MTSIVSIVSPSNLVEDIQRSIVTIASLVLDLYLMLKMAVKDSYPDKVW